jgi:hypothetical protein
MNFNALLLKDGLQRIILQQPVVRAERGWFTSFAGLRPAPDRLV